MFNKYVKKISQIFICCVVSLLVSSAIFSPQTAYAETSIYRSAGWVATDGNPPYSNTTGCQVSNDGLYCSRPSATSFADLNFGSFGNLEDFGIPAGSYITKLHIRIKGKNSAAQLIAVTNEKNKIPFSGACQIPSDLWSAALGSTDTTKEFHTYTSSNGLTVCVTASNIDQEKLTFSLRRSSISPWSTEIDNFEIAFDYNPPTYPWKAQNDLSIPRHGHRAVLLDDGRVLVAGGIYVASSTNIAEIFTPNPDGLGTWTHAKRMIHDRKFHTLHLIENQQTGSKSAIAIGGAAEGCSCIRNSAEIYDPSTNTWTLTPNLNNPRAFHGSSVFENGKVLVSGGIGNTSSTVRHNSTEVYDITTNTWVLKAPLNTVRVLHQQATFTDAEGNTKVMVMGGLDTNENSGANALSSTEIYDPSSDTWFPGPNLNSIRFNFSAITLHDGRILVVGGNTAGDSEVYDPATNTWTTYPTGYRFSQGAVVELGSDTSYKVIAAGSFPVTTNAMLFDPQTNIWTNTDPMNAPRADFTLTLLKDGTALAANGISSFQKTRTSEIYTPSDVVPPQPPLPPAKTPLLLIPGIAGSELKTAEEVNWSQPTSHGGTFTHTYPAEERVWISDLEALKPGEDDYFDILRMHTDGQTSQANLALTGTLFTGYIDTMLFFTSLGYTLDQDFFLFPYDWRKDISLTKPLLDHKIETIKQVTGAEKVDIVAHSMGGLVARNYIGDIGKAQKVRKLIVLGTPHLGTPEFIKNLMYGGCLTINILKKSPLCFGIAPSEVKDVLQNMTGGFELIPSLAYFDFYSGEDNLHPFPFRDDRDIDNDNVTGPLNYSQIKTLHTNLGYNTPLFTPTEAFHALDQTLADTNGVEVSIIAGSGKNTLGQIIEKYRVNLKGIKIPQKDKITINGDETVPLLSVSLSDPHKNLSLLGSASLYYTNQEHGALVADGPALDLVRNILDDDATLPDGVSLEPYKLKGHELSVHSPVDIHVYDQDGNHTGPIENGDAQANIPGSDYDTLEDAKFVWLPDDGVFNIIFESTGGGSFDFKIRKFEEDINTQTILYKDIPLTNSTIGNTIFDTQSPQPPILNIDTNGDGEEDFQVGHFSVLEGDANYDQTPPTTKIILNGTKGNNGWFIGNVNISLDAFDDNSEIAKTEYSLDNGESIQKYNRPFTLENDGVYKIKAKSTDKAGNEEIPKEIEIKIDKIPPEAKIFVDQDKQELTVEGVDRSQTVIQRLPNTNTGNKDDTIYLIADKAGNILQLDARENNKEKRDTFRIYSLRYNQDAPIYQSDNRLGVYYIKRKSKLNPILQSYRTKKEKIIIKYDSSKNESVIITKKAGEKWGIETQPGLALLELATETGILRYSY